jgi:hypothetical protein
VLGQPREIQEVRNAFAAYEVMEDWKPASLDNLLTAHGLLMSVLVGSSRRVPFRRRGYFSGRTAGA